MTTPNPNRCRAVIKPRNGAYRASMPCGRPAKDGSRFCYRHQEHERPNAIQQAARA